MFAPLAFAVAAATVIAPPAGPDDACPSSRQVTEALQAHIGSVIVAPDRPVPARTDALRAVLEVPPDGTVVRFSLIDGRGDVQLRRTLAGPGRSRAPADCTALAETIATIVERYLSSIPFQTKETDAPKPPIVEATPEAPPAPPPAPPERDQNAKATRLFVGGAYRASPIGASLLEAQLGGEREVTASWPRLALGLRTSASEKLEATLGKGPDSIQRFAGRLGLALAWPAGPGFFEPSIELGADLFVAKTSSTATSASTVSFKATPVGELRVGYRVALLGYFFLRPLVTAGYAIIRYDLRDAAATEAPNGVVFRTSGFFSTFGIDAGISFR